MKIENYDMVSTLKNRNSKCKYGLTQYDINNDIETGKYQEAFKK